MIQRIRTGALWASIVLAVLVAVLGALVHPAWFLAEIVLVPLVILGVHDVTQTHHAILRNYPIVGHLRFLLEDMGPELHQYVIENSRDGRPFDRDTRGLIYERSKGIAARKAFGTEADVYEEGYTWLAHSIAPNPMPADPVAALRVTVGGADCRQPYDMSVFNVSAMSFGALGSAAIRALNRGAEAGGFAHDTGEGGLSKHHLESGGDLIWQIGTGYFGCRTPDGRFDPETFRTKAALPQVKMIELKISQGAKPGHGGILPGAKVTAEIAEARDVPVGQDVSSPTYHSAFSTPAEMVAFLAHLRDLADGKPVGFKICIGDPVEFLSVVKAMIDADTYPDFIVVDGGEGGTGAAPLEFSDSVGTPLIEGLMIVQNTLVGAGIRDRLKVGASGKLVTASAIARAMALGADWCNSARGFMLAIGCIQAQRCHTNRCPVGVTTQDPRLQRALVVPDKADRVRQFHASTVHALAEIVAAMGIDHPSELRPEHVMKRVTQTEVQSYDEVYPCVAEGSLLVGGAPDRFQRMWDRASTTAFR